MNSEKFEFAGSHGVPLAARLDLPGSEPQAYALFAHCFTCGKEAIAAARISRALTDFGIAVLRFDFTGLGGSGGDFGNTDFSSNVADVVAAADHLRERFAAPALLVGHSLGGAAVLAAAHRVPEVRAVATIGAPADPAHVLHLLEDSRAEIEQRGEAQVVLAGRPFRIRKQFLDDIAAQPQAERIAKLGAALLVMHSPGDEIVGVDNARRIFDAARHPKSFVALDGADHLLTDRADAEFAATMLAAWATRYLPATAEQPSRESDSGFVVVSENGESPYGQSITVGRHSLTADEPRPVGGDSGPNPYDLLLAGLGACTSMTLRMYAKRKQLPLDHVTVKLRHSRIYAEDCANCETQQGKLDRIERVIHLDGDLDAEQRQRLMEIADKCPVHHTLHSEIDVATIEAPRAEGA
ncbi:osmotically inducible protein C [Acrocarpospora phusangensis]|uniref:Osmotically inducible protein C n=1 Tax=Acrocarpospora phusangensis TaxID=1070424 RepID=A0A919UKP0_9ACTN|nr:bifunctional alpha/beta hydrolase/OsmC family protein [Acrocarpospora phusangensis]GIH25246.1 osmotically inducible protein C [Acrocarpospora phusangensis]